MVKKWRVMAGVLITAVGCWVAWHLMTPSEPVYKGKTFSEWLMEWGHTSVEQDPSEAIKAIQHIGTNALPTMVKMLAAKDSPMKKRFKALVQKQTLIKFHWRDEMMTREFASLAFDMFGSAAKPAVPDLTELLSHEDRNVRGRAVEALKFIGPSASNAIPALTQHLQDKDERFVEDVQRALSVIDTNRGLSYEYKKPEN